MSIQDITWALTQDIDRPSAKLLLICLANYTNETGECLPGQKALAGDTGLSDRAIRANIKFLEGPGILSHEHRQREDGSRTADLYQLKSNRKIKPPAKKKATGQPESASGHESVTEPTSPGGRCAGSTGAFGQFKICLGYLPREAGSPGR